MCYHTSNKATPNQLKGVYNAPYPREAQHRTYYHANGFDLPELPVLLQVDGNRLLDNYQWGCVPRYATNILQAKQFARKRLNARSEKVFLNEYKNIIFKNRCILPVTGFFESKHFGKEKVPHYIHPKEQPFFNILGVYSSWTDLATSEIITSFAAITGEANELMASIHNNPNNEKRMPLMIDDENIDTWLDPTLTQSDIEFLMKPCDDRAMAAYPVSRILNKKNIDSNIPEIIEEVPNTTLF